MDPNPNPAKYPDLSKFDGTLGQALDHAFGPLAADEYRHCTVITTARELTPQQERIVHALAAAHLQEQHGQVRIVGTRFGYAWDSDCWGDDENNHRGALIGCVTHRFEATV